MDIQKTTLAALSDGIAQVPNLSGIPTANKWFCTVNNPKRSTAIPCVFLIRPGKWASEGLTNNAGELIGYFDAREEVEALLKSTPPPDWVKLHKIARLRPILNNLKLALRKATDAGLLDIVGSYTEAPNAVNDFCDAVNELYNHPGWLGN
jgi:hypothetical protein